MTTWIVIGNAMLAIGLIAFGWGLGARREARWWSANSISVNCRYGPEIANVLNCMSVTRCEVSGTNAPNEASTLSLRVEGYRR